MRVRVTGIKSLISKAFVWGLSFKQFNDLKMTDQNILPSAPQLYLIIPDDFWLKRICDGQKELKNEITR